MKNIILKALKKVQRYDSHLIKNKMEWATSHRLAVYLENSFPGFNVDCEYNKMGPDFDTKHDSNKKYKRPDIIIHKRGKVELENNLLVIEIKIDSGQNDDEKKLLDFTSTPKKSRPFQYQHGLKISFFPTLKLKWFEDGFLRKIIEYTKQPS